MTPDSQTFVPLQRFISIYLLSPSKQRLKVSRWIQACTDTTLHHFLLHLLKNNTSRNISQAALLSCVSVFFTPSSLSSAYINPPATSHLSTDPINYCFLTGRLLPCLTGEAGASLLLRCDRTPRYAPTDQGLDFCTVTVSVRSLETHPACPLDEAWPPTGWGNNLSSTPELYCN